MKLTRKHWLLLTSLFVTALILWQGWDLFTRPLNYHLPELAAVIANNLLPAGTLPTQDDPNNLPTLVPTPDNYNLAGNAAPVSNPTADKNAATVCGGAKVMFYLITGDDEHHLSDSIRIVRVDFSKADVSVLAIQRATWVSIPNLTAHNIDSGLINSAHSYGDYFLGPGGGISLLSQTITMNFGINIDRYIDVNYNAFIKVVDAVGGMDVYLPNDLDGTLQGLKIYFKAGMQHMDGATALKYVRIRFPDSDWNRIARQTEFGKGLYQKLTTAAMLPRLPGLVVDLRQDVMTDLSPAEMSSLVCLATKVKSSDIRFYEIGVGMVTPTTLKDKNKSQIMLPNWDKIRPFVQNFIFGNLH